MSATRSRSTSERFLAAASFDVDRSPRRVQAVGEPFRIAHEPGRARVLADANKKALAGGPGAGDGVRPHVGEELLVNPLRRAAERKLSKRG